MVTGRMQSTLKPTLDFPFTCTPGGTFVLLTTSTAEELEGKLDTQTKDALAQKDALVYLLDVNKLAKDVGLV